MNVHQNENRLKSNDIRRIFGSKVEQIGFAGFYNETFIENIPRRYVNGFWFDLGFTWKMIWKTKYLATNKVDTNASVEICRDLHWQEFAYYSHENATFIGRTNKNAIECSQTHKCPNDENFRRLNRKKAIHLFTLLIWWKTFVVVFIICMLPSPTTQPRFKAQKNAWSQRVSPEIFMMNG